MRYNSNLDSLITVLIHLTLIYFPKRVLRRRQFKTAKNPWINSGILTSIKHKNKLYAMYLKNKFPKMFASYKKYLNKLTHIKDNAKRKYFENVFRGPCNPSDTWKNIDQIRNGTGQDFLDPTQPVNFKIITGWPAGRPVCDRPVDRFFCRRFLISVQYI